MSINNGKARTSERVAVAGLLFLLLAALLLRLYRLSDGLWLDEILTYLNYAKLSFREIITTYDSENQHFLFSLLAHASLLLFGDNAWALRLPAVLFGVGSIWALYLFGKEVSNHREALLSAALLTFSYHHLWFSQNARGYTGLLFWALLSSWLFVRGLKDNLTRTWLLYALSASLGMYTHMTMIFVISGQFLSFLAFHLTRPQKNWGQISKSFLKGFVLAGLITILFYMPVVKQIMGTIGGSEVSVVAAWKSPLWTLSEIVRGFRIGYTTGIAAFAALGALLLLCSGSLSYLRTRPIVVGLLFIPSILGALTITAIGHHLWPRFFFFVIGFAALIVIRGIMVLSNWFGRMIKLPPTLQNNLGTALSVGLVLLSAVSIPFAYGPKQDYEGALKYVETSTKPGDEVVTVSITAPIYRDYFHTGWLEVTSLDNLDQIKMSANRTWIVYTFPPVLESIYPDIMANIRQDFTPIKEFPGTVSEGTIFVSRFDNP